MIHEFKAHPYHYLTLFLILLLGFTSLLLFRFDPILKNISIYSLAGLYVLWGYFHHQQADQVRLKVMLEYFLVSLLGAIIIQTIL